METIIQELIAYDRQAKEIMMQALKAKEKVERELPEEEEKLYRDFLARAKGRTSRIQEQVAGSRRDDIAKMEEIFRLESARLEKSFADNRERWEQELFDRCIASE